MMRRKERGGGGGGGDGGPPYHLLVEQGGPPPHLLGEGGPPSPTPPPPPSPSSKVPLGVADINTSLCSAMLGLVLPDQAFRHYQARRKEAKVGLRGLCTQQQQLKQAEKYQKCY